MFSHFRARPQPPTENQAQTPSRQLYKAAPLVPAPTSAPAITAFATSSCPTAPPSPELQPGPGFREVSAPPEAEKGLRKQRSAQTWRRPLPQPRLRQPRGRHVSFGFGRPQHSRPGNTGRTVAPPPCQAASRTTLLTMMTDGGGFSQADPNYASRAVDGGDDGGRER